MTDLRPPDLQQVVAPYKAGDGVSGLDVSREDTVDLIAVARLFVREWPLIVGIVAMLALAAGGVAVTTTPTYRAEVLLAPVSPPRGETLAALGPLGDIANLVEQVVGTSRDRTSESIATLRSRSLALDFIGKHELKRLLFADRWDASAGAWRSDVPAPSDLEAYDLFDRTIRGVKLDRRTGLVTLSIDWRDPAQAARWANELVREVNARRRSEAVEEAQKSIEYLQRQVARTSSLDVRQAIFRLIEVQTKTIAVARAREEYAFRVIDEALAPERPVHPRPLLLIAIAVLAGLALAAFIVLVKHALRRSRRAGA